ncbi:hypothetical protein [Daejeonella sp.]|uniref:hypothetical protein n=1 Tax=Daejeonella sp. TaxID=2805397 RepID=UPI0030C0F410
MISALITLLLVIKSFVLPHSTALTAKAFDNVTKMASPHPEYKLCVLEYRTTNSDLKMLFEREKANSLMNKQRSTAPETFNKERFRLVELSKTINQEIDVKNIRFLIDTAYSELQYLVITEIK